MSARRTMLSILAASLIAMVAIGPVSAAKPATAAAAPAPAAEGLLSADQEAAEAAKLAAATEYLQGVDAAGGDLLGLDCVSPTADGAVSPDAATLDGCYVPQGFLSVSPRDQILGHYCGPAVGQVISNYSWAVASSANRFTQREIAGWMQTDLNGGTSAYSMEAGLERATAGSPRRPATWDWVVSSLRDWDGDGQIGDGLHGMLQANVSGSKMPLAISVKPHDPASQYHLSSWPRAVRSPGHWIAAYGWVGSWTGGDYARTYYTDSSKDEGGATGWFWDPTRHVAAMIMEHTQRLVW